MTSIDRRGLMKGAMVGVALAGMPSALFAMTEKPRLFIYDGRFAEAEAAARTWRAAGVEILDRREKDLGLAWRDVIPEALLLGGGIAGMTMWFDSYICESLGRDRGLAIRRQGALLAHGLQHWVLR